MVRVITYPSAALSTNSLAKEFVLGADNGEYLPYLVDCMVDVVYCLKALGLAANQIGECEPVFVMDLDGDPLIAINPSIKLIGELVYMEEACLSLPGISAKVERHRKVLLTYTDMDFITRTILLSDLHVQVAQHEMDHLAGKLYWDRLSSLKRDILKKKYKKARKIR
jgi:peptide deformylase